MLKEVVVEYELRSKITSRLCCSVSIGRIPCSNVLPNPVTASKLKRVVVLERKSKSRPCWEVQSHGSGKAQS